jgi:prepilin-type processing-associated H-X9-DG protein
MVDYNSYLPTQMERNPQTADQPVTSWPIEISNYLGIKGSPLPTTARLNEVYPPKKAPEGMWLCPVTKLAPGAGSVMRISYGVTVCSSSEAQAQGRPGGFVLWDAQTGHWPVDGRFGHKKSNNIPPNSVLIIEKSLITRPTGYPYEYNFSWYTTHFYDHPFWSADFRHNRTSNFLFMDLHVSSLVRGTKFDTNWKEK